MGLVYTNRSVACSRKGPSHGKDHDTASCHRHWEGFGSSLGAKRAQPSASSFVVYLSPTFARHQERHPTMSIRSSAAIAACKVVHRGMRLLGRTARAMPGAVALVIDPRIIDKLSESVMEGYEGTTTTSTTTTTTTRVKGGTVERTWGKRF